METLKLIFGGFILLMFALTYLRLAFYSPFEDEWQALGNRISKWWEKL